MLTPPRSGTAVLGKTAQAGCGSRWELVSATTVCINSTFDQLYIFSFSEEIESGPPRAKKKRRAPGIARPTGKILLHFSYRSSPCHQPTPLPDDSRLWLKRRRPGPKARQRILLHFSYGCAQPVDNSPFLLHFSYGYAHFPVDRREILLHFSYLHPHPAEAPPQGFPVHGRKILLHFSYRFVTLFLLLLLYQEDYK